jgi:hypothetical protein
MWQGNGLRNREGKESLVSENASVVFSGNSGTVSINSGGMKSSIKIGANGSATFSGSAKPISVSYNPSTGQYQERVNLKFAGGVASFSFGNNKTVNPDGSVTYNSMAFGFSGKMPGGGGISANLTVGAGVDGNGNHGFRFSGDFSVGLPGGQVNFNTGFEDVFWDPADLFDPEKEGPFSDGALGKAFSLMKNRGAQIEVSSTGIDPRSNTSFKRATQFVQVSDPLALDLDSDGIETVSADSGITFDFDGDGLKTGTGWVKGDDGFLVLDRNGNGSIDNGNELFGVDTVKDNGQKASNGFDALRDLDGNADGVFDAQDEQFANVRVWQDLNQDGVAQAYELKSLAEHDITAINLGSTATNQNSNGNLISAVGTFVRGDGSEGSVNGNQSLAANLDLATNPFYREHTDTIALSDSVKALSDMKGSGAVRDLREAAMLSSQLQSQLSQYNQASRPDQVGMLDTLLRTWAATADYRTWDQRIGDLGNDIVEVSFAYSWERATTDGIGSGASSSGSQAEIDSAKEDTGPTAEQLEKQQLLERVKILEIFNAQNFFNFSRDESSADSSGDALVAFSLSSGANTRSRSMFVGGREVVLTEEDININAGQAELLNKSYESLLHSLYRGLVVQAHLKPYLDVIGLVFSNAEPVLDFSVTQQLFLQNAEQNPAETMLDIADFMSYMKFAGKDMLNWGSFTDRMLTSLSEADAVEFYRQVSLLPLPDEDESVRFGTHNSDSFKGGAGADTFFAGAGDDALDGATGSNTLFGGAGNDTLKVHLSSKDNLLSGGTGDDTLVGSYYADTYVFNLGDGVDTITESANGTSTVYTDILRFGEGIAVTDIQTQRVGVDFVFSHSNGMDKVVLKGIFSATSSTSNYLGKV